jgi:small membrane protein
MIFAKAFLMVLIAAAVAHVILRYRQQKIGSVGFLLWLLLWCGASIIVLFPDTTMVAARTFGIGRGADLVLYVSVIALFYLIFRMQVQLEQISREITRIVRTIALNGPAGGASRNDPPAGTRPKNDNP